MAGPTNLIFLKYQAQETYENNLGVPAPNPAVVPYGTIALTGYLATGNANTKVSAAAPINGSGGTGEMIAQGTTLTKNGHMITLQNIVANTFAARQRLKGS